MITKKIEINYNEYDSISELSAPDKELMEKAIETLGGSYAPYSNFNVAAAVRMTDGTIVTGANQENIAYPSGLCAERTAIFSAHAQFPKENITAIAIVSAQDDVLLPTPVAPCGACRQVMAESQMRYGKPVRVLLGGSGRIIEFSSVDGILPYVFNNEEVKRKKR